MSVSPKALRVWLLALSVVAAVGACLSLVFGWAIMLDTEFKVIPSVDAAVRQDAVEMRVIAWVAIALFILMLGAGTVGGWIAYRRGRFRRAIGFSLLAGVPILLCFSSFALIYFQRNP